MAFTYDVSTTLGKLRLYTTDTGGVAPGETATSGSYLFEDAEHQIFIDDGGTVSGAVVQWARALIGSRAMRAKRFTLLGLTLDDTAQLAALQELIKQHGGLPTAKVVSTRPLPMDAAFDEANP